MSNDNNKHVSVHHKLDEAVMGLVKALVVQASRNWPSSEVEEIVGAEVGAGWEQVYKYLGEIEYYAEARAQAQTLEKVMFYITEVKGITLDDYDRRELELVVSEDNPYWYQPE